MTYRPTFRRQGDGSRYQWSNCNCVSHAMASDRHRRGVDPKNHHGCKPTPVEIRNWILAQYHDTNGTSLPQNRRLASTCTKSTCSSATNCPGPRSGR